MTDTRNNEPHHYCWHQIAYALARWTIPAIFLSLPLLLAI